MRHPLTRLATALLALAAAAPAGAQATVPAAPVVASADHPWLVTLSALLAVRYQTTGDLRLSFTRPLAAGSPLQADLEILAAPAELAPQILLQVRARDDAGRVTEQVLVVRAELWREGWTLRRPAIPGAALEPTDLEPRSHDALRERDALCATPGSPLPELDFARPVPAGRLLVWRDVLRRPLVRRGQSVDVVASEGSLTVSLRAIALNDAARGETVRVRNPDSRREFTATVIADARAAVRF